jgi:prepilin-type N-terminal cleavage/methylation domain-containing protein
MYRGPSEPRPHRASGFTLIEVVIGLAVSGILILVITRFFTDSHRAYNLQERLADRDQNAQWVLKRIEERLMEAGANLPDSGWPVIVPGANPRSGFTLAVNPHGGSQTFYQARAADRRVPVDDGASFKGASALLILRADKSKPVEKAKIDLGYNQGGFTKGFKQGSNGQDTLRLETKLALAPGDVAYGFATEEYAIAGTDVSMGGMVLAEDIESVALDFYDSTGAPTTDWNSMHAAKVSVTARTRQPDPGSPGDGYRRVILNSEVRLRNRP